MSRFHILPPSWTSGATATASSEASSLVPGSNLLLIQQSIKWRSAALGTLQVTLDAQQVLPWDTLFLGYHNGTSSGTIRVTSNASTGTLFSSPSFDTGTQQLTFSGDLSPFLENHSWVATGTTQNFRYIGIEVVDGSNPDGFFQAGVVVVGELFTPPIGADLGATFGYQDNSESIELVNSETLVRPKRGRNVGSWSFPKQSVADAFGSWMPIHRVYGSKIPIVCKWDPIISGYEQFLIYYGYAQWRDNGPFTFSNGAGLYDVEMGIREV